MYEIDLNLLKKHRIWWDLVKKNYFGKINGDKIYLNIFEILYLYENRVSKKKFKKLEKLKNKHLKKFLVFKDLIKKGFVVKTALKYGFDFRIYRKKDFKEGEHSLYLVFILDENKNIDSKDLIAKFRIAHSVRKRVLFAFVDSEASIVYYESKWLRI